MSDAARMDRIESRLLAVEKESNQLHGVIVGIDDQGGLIHRLEKVAAQGHKLANDLAGMQLGVQMMQENVQAIIEAVKR